jgi:carbonic anhydrase
VLNQIANLKTHPSVWSRLLKGEIEIRGWVYDIGDGSIRETLSENGRFELLGHP